MIYELFNVWFMSELNKNISDLIILFISGLNNWYMGNFLCDGWVNWIFDIK